LSFLRGALSLPRIRFPMKRLLAILSVSASIPALAADAPKIFSGLFEKGVPVKGELGVVIPPPEIDKYIGKVADAARKDPEWYKEYSKKTKPGIPLPFDAKLGLTKEEYDEYIKLWGKREFKVADEVQLMLKENANGSWTIITTGEGGAISTLQYQPQGDLFHSPDGDLKRIEDVNADPQSVLGGWTGFEWKFEEETGLGKTKENFALGKMAGGKYGLVIFRAQEVSSEGTPLMDKALVIRFPLGTKPAAPQKSSASGKPAGNKN